MVVKLMGSAPSMSSAVMYNENKVKEGEAVIIAQVNPDSGLSVLDTFSRLERMNIRSKEVSFHMSVNPAEGERMKESDVIRFVSELMSGLGYGSQPYVIYRHDDIERSHYHVVSIRTDHRGKKIPDRQEQRKCMSVIEGLAPYYGFRVGNGNAEALVELGIDPRRFDHSKGHVAAQLEAIVQRCLSYRFTSQEQFKLLMRTHGVSVSFREGGTAVLQGLADDGRQCTKPVDERALSIAVNDEVADRIALSLSSGRGPVREAQKVARIVAACLPHADSVRGFESMLERKGISCHVRRRDDGRIVGATFIDKDTRCVFGSSEIRTFKASELNAIESKGKVQDSGRSQKASGRKM